MLVLSRKADQKIVFPNLGITLKLLSVKGNLARIGIEAPSDMPVLREELVDESAAPGAPYVSRELRHDVRNSLNTIRLAVELFQRQMEAGLPDKAQSTIPANHIERSRPDLVLRLFSQCEVDRLGGVQIESSIADR